MDIVPKIIIRINVILKLTLLFIFVQGCTNLNDRGAMDSLGRIAKFGKISILPGHHLGIRLLDATKIVSIVKKYFNAENDVSSYKEYNVSVIYNKEDKPDYLIVYLLGKDSYSIKTAKINLDENYDDSEIVYDYRVSSDDIEQSNRGYQKMSYARCPDPKVKFVFSAVTTEFPTAIDGIRKAREYALEGGYSDDEVVLLVGREATLDAYKNWLSCPNLKGFGNIGHGLTHGIYLGDGRMLTNQYFESLPEDYGKGKVMYYNSCYVHNRPFEPAVVGAGFQKFIGGTVPLMVGPSEKVFKCFWQNILVGNRNGSMKDIIARCEMERYKYSDWGYVIGVGHHGFSGNGSDIFNHQNPIEQEGDSNNEGLNNASSSNSNDSASAVKSNTDITIAIGKPDANQPSVLPVVFASVKEVSKLIACYGAAKDCVNKKQLSDQETVINISRQSKDRNFYDNHAFNSNPSNLEFSLLGYDNSNKLIRYRRVRLEKSF